MTNISTRGRCIVLKFWQCVLLDQRNILCLQHNFMRVTDFCYNQAKFQPGSCGCQVSYGKLISPSLIYNSKTRNRIFTKFSASKHSSMEKMSAKFRRPEIVAMEAVTDSFFLFNARHLNRGSIHGLEILRICSPRPKVHFMFGK